MPGPRPSHAGLVLWLDAADAGSLDVDAAGRIVCWRDRSGTGHDATPATGTPAPVLVSHALNGRPALHFTGDESLNVVAIRGTPGPISTFVVWQRSPDQASPHKWQRLLSSWDSVSANDHQQPGFCMTATARGTGEASPAIVDERFGDGVIIGPLAIGANRQQSGQNLRGDIAEILIYNRPFVAEDEIQAVLHYLAGKWDARIGREERGWTRVGPLGQTPVRTHDGLPLSDQSNRGNWVPYEPMWDEFDEAGLDETRWWPINPRWQGRKPALFSADNVCSCVGELQLIMRLEDVEDAPPGYHTFTSAAVQSKTTVKYGYFEIEAKPMRSAGSSAFWFYNNEPERWTEIDVFEIGGGAPGFERKYNMNAHVFHTPEEKRHWNRGGSWLAPWDLADDYHVYGLEWDADVIRYYVDGVVVREMKNTHWHQALTLNFDSETMPTWFGLPDTKDLPSTFRVRYVHAWKRDENK